MNYNDIIQLPHHVSETRPRMPMLARAAQFAPFAALSGFDEIIDETTRTSEERAEPPRDFDAENSPAQRGNNHVNCLTNITSHP